MFGLVYFGPHQTQFNFKFGSGMKREVPKQMQSLCSLHLFDDVNDISTLWTEPKYMKYLEKVSVKYWYSLAKLHYWYYVFSVINFLWELENLLYSSVSVPASSGAL